VPSALLRQDSVLLLQVLLRNYTTTVNTIGLLRHPHQVGNATIMDVTLLLLHWAPQPPGSLTTSALTAAVPRLFRLIPLVRMTRISIVDARLLALQLALQLQGLLPRHSMIIEGIDPDPRQPHHHSRVGANTVAGIGSEKQHSVRQPPPASSTIVTAVPVLAPALAPASEETMPTD